jgi:hypothetical protein
MDFRRSDFSIPGAYIPGAEVFPDFQGVTEPRFDSERELDEFLSQMLNGEQGFACEPALATFLSKGTTAWLQLMRRSRYAALTRPYGSSCMQPNPPAQYILLKCGLKSLKRSNHDRR